MTDDAIGEVDPDDFADTCPHCGAEGKQLARLGPTLEVVCQNDDCPVQLFTPESAALERFNSDSPPFLFYIGGEITNEQRKVIMDGVREVIDDD